MKQDQVKHSNEIPGYVYDGLVTASQRQSSEKINKRKASILNHIKEGRVLLADAKEEMELKDCGLGVLEANDGKVWWVEGNDIVRQDDLYIEQAIKIAEEREAQKTSQKETGADMEKKVPTTIETKIMPQGPKGIPETEYMSAADALPVVKELVDNLISINADIDKVEEKLQLLKEGEGLAKLQYKQDEVARQIFEKFSEQLKEKTRIISKMQEKFLVVQSEIIKKQPTPTEKLNMVLEKFSEAEKYLKNAVAQLTETYTKDKVIVVDPSRRKGQADQGAFDLEAAYSSFAEAISKLAEGLALLE